MHGYPIESHFVTTEDGYILNVHRIPTGKQGQTNGKAVFLEHELSGSSSTWVLLGPGKALAYILADEGYDVWMGNTRGNEYSRNHTSLDPDESDFWDFSWHEIGVYDLPAIIDYIIVNTNISRVYYSGHSQGTTCFYIMGSERPEYNDKIQVYAHFSPVAYMSNLISPVFELLGLVQRLNPNIIQQVFGPELLKSDGLISVLTSEPCQNLLGTALCGNILYASIGFSTDIIEPSILEEMAQQYPSGTSTMQLVHYLQLYNSGTFRQYDRGLLGNLVRYGQVTPPVYNVSAVTAPGYVFYAMDDWISDYRFDVPRLYNELGNCLGKFLHSSATFKHLDYLFSESTLEVYNQIVVLFSLH